MFIAFGEGFVLSMWRRMAELENGTLCYYHFQTIIPPSSLQNLQLWISCYLVWSPNISFLCCQLPIFVTLSCIFQTHQLPSHGYTLWFHFCLNAWQFLENTYPFWCRLFLSLLNLLYNIASVLFLIFGFNICGILVFQWTQPSRIGKWSLNHWTSREIPWQF